jgi:hypothetical protein
MSATLNRPPDLVIDGSGSGAGGPAALAANIKATSTTSYQIDLPSGGVFYNGKRNIQVSPFLADHICELHAAFQHVSQYEKDRSIVNTINKCVHDFDVFNMTIGDFRFLAYWLQLNSYKKSPKVISWEYDWNDTHYRAAANVQLTNFIVKEVNRHTKLKDKRFWYRTMSDHLSILEISDPTDKYFADFASYLKGKDLDEKVRFLKTLSADALLEIIDHKNEFEHGIVEVAKVKDPQNPDAGEFEVTVSLNFSDMFPALF